MTRITITCEDCGRRHRLERSVGAPGMIWIVCHECELPLHAVLEAPARFDEPAAAPASAPVPSAAFEAAWAGMFDLSAR
jgi:hypothetical protein